MCSRIYIESDEIIGWQFLEGVTRIEVTDGVTRRIVEYPGQIAPADMFQVVRVDALGDMLADLCKHCQTRGFD